MKNNTITLTGDTELKIVLNPIIVQVKEVIKPTTDGKTVREIEVVREIDGSEQLRKDFLAVQPDIIAALKEKGIISSGELLQLASDIRKISTGTIIETSNPNIEQNISMKSEVLSYEIIPDSYIDTNGNEISYWGWDSTSYINVEGYEELEIENGDLSWSCYFDEEKNGLGTVDTFYPNVPSNAKYVRISNDSSIFAALKVMGKKRI